MMLQYIVPVVVWTPLGIYLFCLIRRFLTFFHLEERRRLCIGISLGLTGFLIYKGWRVYGLWAMLTLHFLTVCAIMEIVWKTAKKYLKQGTAKKVLLFLYRSCLLSWIVVAFVCGYGSYHIRDVRETEYELKTKKELPKSVKIIQISDLHAGTTMSAREFRKYCRKIEEERPDLIALTGDIFDENTTRQQMKAVAKEIGAIQTTYGIFYVFGNHDYNHYVSTPNYTSEELKRELKMLKIHVLEDSVCRVQKNFFVAGRRDASVPRAEIEDILGQVPKDSFLLLLDHQPKNLENNQKAGVDLQLSGHTHAGQIWPTGQLGSLMGITELNYGLKKEKNYHAIVSSGMGGWGYPIRTGGHSEYVKITLTQHYQK